MSGGIAVGATIRRLDMGDDASRDAVVTAVTYPCAIDGEFAAHPSFVVTDPLDGLPHDWCKQQVRAIIPGGHLADEEALVESAPPAGDVNIDTPLGLPETPEPPA